MDAYVRDIPTLRTPSSERVFGEELRPIGAAPDAVPAEIFFASPVVEPAHQRLITEAHRRLLRGARDVLDLLAGPTSYLPEAALRVSGLGASAAALQQNPRLTTGVVQDLNADPQLPFATASFDAVLVSLDVGLLQRPLEVFREVGRVLRPGGVVVLTFIHACYSRDLTRLWALSDDREHVVLGEAFIEFATAGFRRPQSVSLVEGDEGLAWSLGGLLPEDRRHPYVFAIYAFRGEEPATHREAPPFPPPAQPAACTDADLRYDDAGRPRCPYCGTTMGRYEPPTTIFEIEYGVPLLWVCFDDRCEYHRRSRRWMRAQGHAGYCLRCMWNPTNGALGSIPDSLFGGLASCRVD